MAAMKVQLLGPPQIHRQQQQPLNPSNVDDSNLRGRTENNAPTFLSTDDPCIDFFYHIVPDTPPETLVQRLELAWKHDPLTTLKLVCNLRGVRGTGKSDKEGFYGSALWLHKNHPKTLAGNLKWFADFGYFKDLPEILFRLIQGLDVRKKAKEEASMRQRFGRGFGRGGRITNKGWNSGRMKRMRMAVDNNDVKKKKKKKKDEEEPKKSKNESNIEKGKKALEMYCNDEGYRFLHDRISDLFAEYLIADLKLLNAGETKQISLASKWCPNLDSSFDRATLLCESIARRVFPREEYPEYQGIEDAHYAYRVRDRLRKQYLVPLHQALEIPEVYLCSKRWDSLPYNRVPSVAMRNYKSFFEKHDEERFKDYLEKVKTGKTTIAAGALLPHEIIQSLEDVSIDENKDKNDVAELQWRRMVEDLTEKGKLRDCLAICDVSESMSGTPMEVCVALGLLVSEMNEDPWKGKVITFSADPQLHQIEGEDLYSKTTFIRQMDWGHNTNFQKVFDLILQVAINGKLREDQMIKRLFVFSDMEFDEASSGDTCGYVYNPLTDNYEINNNGNSWETDYQAIQRKFQESGYGNSVPQIIFWNLRNSMATPVTAEENGVALVSGFSKNLLTLFLDGMDNTLKKDMNPKIVMETAISGEEYQQLVNFRREAGNFGQNLSCTTDLLVGVVVNIALGCMIAVSLYQKDSLDECNILMELYLAAWVEAERLGSRFSVQ